MKHSNTHNFQSYKRTQEGKRRSFASNIEEPYKTPFSEEEIHHEMTKTNETSYGQVQFTHSMIKNNHMTLKNAVLNLNNKIFMNKVFPITLAVATILSIPKPGTHKLYM